MLSHLIILIKIRIIIASNIFDGSTLPLVCFLDFSMFIGYARTWSFRTLLERIKQPIRRRSIILLIGNRLLFSHIILSGALGDIHISLPFIRYIDTHITILLTLLLLLLLLFKCQHLLSVLSSCYNILYCIIYKAIRFVSC